MPQPQGAPARRELILVMPVYNEAECISGVVRQWRDAFERLAIDFELLVLNDGSKDETARELASFADDPRVRVVNKANSGHGPTILQGYREAVSRAGWVFQVDSDDEMGPESFAGFWKRRGRYDALFGVRWHREQDGPRRVLSAGSRVLVGLLFGQGVRDVNVPYRLMRSRVLKPIVEAIPDDTFAPNLLISGVLGRGRGRVTNRLVPHENRKTGTASLDPRKLGRIALLSGRQTLAFMLRFRFKGLA
jgi:dolichol-phosphate mannosyltransferase